MKKVGLISLGCPKNQVDSETMLGRLAKAGYTFTSDLSEAEIIIINTCSFIEAARKESIETIIETASMKGSGALKRLIVAGCLPQRYIGELQRSIPEGDAFLGIDDIERIDAICDHTGRFISNVASSPPRYLFSEDSPRMLTGRSFSAYVKIADGCDNPCSFCAIPAIRGSYRSRKIDAVVKEVRDLAESGVREINLVAQDTTAYGIDLNKQDHLSDLLTALSKTEKLRWIRILYGYPSRITPRLIETIAQSPKVCKYLDIPFQHASAGILKSMKRGGSKKAFLTLIDDLRMSIPEMTLRTSVIVGYPGETSEDFNELLSFCMEVRFDHLGVFRYSPEEGTEAFDLADDVPEHIKEDRERILMEMQQGILHEKQKEKIGGEYELLCEGACEESDDLLTGRLKSQAPEIDGRVLINEGRAQAGEFVKVRITESHPYDLIGRIVGYVP